ncbi:MAG: nucleotidyltransferase family protein [Acidobacteriota bacterium]|nr:nucleotidyltransferase family protein [Acidobacteriota bacterium]
MPGRPSPAVLDTLLVHPDRIDRRALEAVDPGTLLRAATLEHVVPLAARALQAVAPGGAHAALMHGEAAAWTLREAAEREAIGDFLDAARGVPLLFFKGASTAYSLYEPPSLRMKEDWDVLTAPGAEAAARAALVRAGFQLDPASKPGRVRMRQKSYRRDVSGSEAIVDLHMRSLNPPALADRIRFSDLDAHSVPLAALHAAARGIRDDAALVLACVHRLAHHSSEPRLAWDWDVLLLMRRSEGDMAGEASALARAWGAGRFLAEEVRRVASRFDEPLPDPLRHAIEALEREPARDAGFARANRTRAREFALDWRVLGWRDRAALVRETIAPDTAFLRASTGSRLPLPLLYMTRIARGARAWFRRVP